MKVRIETYLGESEEPESERVIDHDDSLHRQWLGKHIFWAVRNGRAVTITPVEGEEA